MDKGLRRFGSTEDYCHFLRGVLWQRLKRAADGLLPGGGAGRRRGLHNTPTATPFLPVQHPLTALPEPGRTTSYLGHPAYFF